MPDSSPNAHRQIARAAGTVMAAFVISNLTGLVRMILVAQVFGTSAEIDAFSAANRVSETLFTLVAGGALSSAFIPTFTSLLTRGERRDAWKLASAVANLVLIILMGLAALTAVFAPQVVRYVLAPGFAGDPAQEALAVDLLRLQLPSAVLFGLSGLVMGVLNSHQSFLVPALTPSMYQIGMIFGVLVLSPSMGIYGLGWGVVIGAAMHLILQIPSLLKLRGNYFPTFGLKLPATRETIALMGPRLLGVAVVQLNFWVNTRLASSMVEGSVIGITLAFALMLMPQAAIAQSIAIAAMPTFSAQVALGKLDEMRSALASSLRGALLLSIPASVGLLLLRVPVITLLYQHGRFTERSTQLVAWALLWYAAGLVGHSLVEILSRAYYSLHDTLTPVLVGAGAMSLNVLFSLVFSHWFELAGWMPHGGLALANSLATALEAGVLVVLMRRKLSGLKGRYILDGALRAAAATLVMGLVLWLWIDKLQQPAWLVGLGGVGLGSLVFGMVALALGIREFQSGVQLVMRRLRVMIG
jgi:putative peptidoglycan lipid II flippase